MSLEETLGIITGVIIISVVFVYLMTRPDNGDRVFRV